MNLTKTIVLSGFTVVVMLITQFIFAQESAVTTAPDQTVITSNQPASSPKETDLQWAWGEVTNLDNQAKTITLKYLDYEIDQEKEMVLAVDEKTTFENIKDFNELKLKDTLSIDYIVGADNLNIAKHVSFEKPDISSSVAPETAVPDLAQPAAQSETPVDSSIAAKETSAPVEPTAAPAPVESVSAPASVEPAAVPAASEPVPAVQSQTQ